MSVMPRITVVPPFTTRIMDELLPANLKTPIIKRFDGAGDLDEHIKAYRAAMMLMGGNNTVMCMVFFSTLGGVAQRWFIELSGKSIDTFYDLAIKFTTHFLQGRKAKKHCCYLATVK